MSSNKQTKKKPSILILSIVCGYLVVGASRLMWKSIPYFFVLL